MKRLIFSLMFFILFCLPVNKIFAQTCTLQPSGLVAWYPGNGNANDVSVNDNNGTLQGGVAFASGMVQQTFGFNGTTSFVSAPSSTANRVTGSFTIDAWVCLNAYSPEFAPIVSKWNDIRTNNRSNFLAFGSTGTLRFFVSHNGNDYNSVSSSLTVPLNQFTHVAGVFDASAQTMRVYINGVQRGELISEQTSVFASNEPLLIGAGDLGSNIRDFTNGQIDEVDLFNRALTQSEIQAIFNAGSAGKCLSAPTSDFDFDGDSKTDISIFRPSVGEWWINRSSTSQVVAGAFGNSSDKIVPADFTGDGKSDLAVWRGSTGEWFILRSEDASYYSVPFGQADDVPAPADFDGDGKADPTVFRPSNGTWFINKSSGGTDILTFGQAGDVPVVGDYDGDGKADIAIFRPSNGQWLLSRSTAGIVAATFGVSSDKPVPGDYTGDGKTDIAFWRPVSGEWFILRSENSSFFSVPFGQTGDIPTPGDFDGDGKTDTAVFRGGVWYVQQSASGILIRQFGLGDDKPVPSAFVP